MPTSSFLILNTGAKIPTVGLGTWQSAPGEVETAVEIALRHGYRHIDTAPSYENETQVGIGLRASGVARSDVFLTTKLNNCDHGRAQDALDDSLKALRTIYLDLWLMHWPAPMTEGCEAPDRSKDWVDTWRKMVEVYKANPDKVKAIGVSNFSQEYLECLLANSDTVPAVNQIELHPFCLQEDLVSYCRSKGVVVTAYSPLGSSDSPILTNGVVIQLAEKHEIQPANLLISLQANREGVVVIPKSVTEKRIKANFDNIIELTSEEIQALYALDTEKNHLRVCHPNWTGWGGLGFPDCADAEPWG